MVFYPLVIRGAVDRQRQIGTVLVGEERRACGEVPQTVDGLMRRPTLAVKHLSFRRGWYFSPLPHPDRASSRLRDETLGETLNRMLPSETLSDVFRTATSRSRSGASTGTGNSTAGRRKRGLAQRACADRRSRTNASLLYGEEHGAGRIRMTSHNSNSLFGSRSSASEEEGAGRSLRSLSSNSTGNATNADISMRNSSFHTAVPSHGCMRVRSLEESLASCRRDDAQSSDETPGEIDKNEGRDRILGRLSPKRDRSSKSARISNSELDVTLMSISSQGTLGACRFGRTGSSSHLGSVQFGTISIREYANTIGDNPSCGDGPALSLSWAFRSQPVVMSVDEYESSRPPTKRVLDALAIPRERRERILVRLGFSYEDILQAMVEKRYDQSCRERTLSRLKYQALEERMEVLSLRCNRRG